MFLYKENPPGSLIVVSVCNNDCMVLFVLYVLYFDPFEVKN